MARRKVCTEGTHRQTNERHKVWPPAWRLVGQAFYRPAGPRRPECTFPAAAIAPRSLTLTAWHVANTGPRRRQERAVESSVRLRNCRQTSSYLDTLPHRSCLCGHHHDRHIRVGRNKSRHNRRIHNTQGEWAPRIHMLESRRLIGERHSPQGGSNLNAKVDSDGRSSY